MGKFKILDIKKCKMSENKKLKKQNKSKINKQNKKTINETNVQISNSENDSNFDALEFSGSDDSESPELCTEVENFINKLKFSEVKRDLYSSDEDLDMEGKNPRKKVKIEYNKTEKKSIKINNSESEIKSNESKQGLKENKHIQKSKLKKGTTESKKSAKTTTDWKEEGPFCKSSLNEKVVKVKKLKLKKKSKGISNSNNLKNSINKNKNEFNSSELQNILRSSNALGETTESLDLSNSSNGAIQSFKSVTRDNKITSNNFKTGENSEDNCDDKVNKDENTLKKEALKEQLMKKLQSASFRLYNENLYTSSGSDSFKLFKDDPEAFKVYHEGFQTQVSQWPINPLSLIISWLRKKPKQWKIADFGCGEATLEKSVKQKVFSLDLVASVSSVIECNMAHTPLEDKSVNVVVFCLSLMGTNLEEYIVEANRVLVERGVLKIAEVESRFESVNKFLRTMMNLGFECIYKNQKQKYFWLFDFLKIKNVKLNRKTPTLFLKPCMYKKR